MGDGVGLGTRVPFVESPVVKFSAITGFMREPRNRIKQDGMREILSGQGNEDEDGRNSEDAPFDFGGPLVFG